MEEDIKGSELSNVIRIDDERARDHLGRIVRGTVEETLNAMLEAEADPLCNAGRYERTETRRDQRSGSYDCKLQTKAGEVRLKVPKLHRQAFETAIIERYRHRLCQRPCSRQTIRKPASDNRQATAAPAPMINMSAGSCAMRNAPIIAIQRVRKGGRQGRSYAPPRVLQPTQRQLNIRTLTSLDLPKSVELLASVMRKVSLLLN